MNCLLRKLMEEKVGIAFKKRLSRMLPQDVSLNLCVIDDNNSMRPGLLKILHNNGNVSLSFYRELPETKKISQIPDDVYQLSDFTMIKTDSKDKLILTLAGSRSRCQLYFQTDNDIAIFQRYISSKVRLRNSSCNPCVYLLEPLDETVTTVTPFSSTLLPNPYPQDKPYRVSLQNLEASGLSFKSEETVEKLSAADFSKLFDSEGRVLNINEFSQSLYNKDIDKSVLGKLLQIFLFPDFTKNTQKERDEFIASKREIYKKVKIQWELTSFKQWQNYPELRNLVDLIEKDLDEYSSLFSHFQNPRNVQTITFDILLTLSMWNHDEGMYTKGMLTYIIPFINSFVKDATEKDVTCHDGHVCSYDEVESDIFWCFNQFYESNTISELIRPTNQPLLKTLFLAVGRVLELALPDILQLLFQKHAYSLDFMLEDCSRWYTTIFANDEIIRLWISAFAYSLTANTFEFHQYFAPSLLFSMAPAMIEMNPLNNEEFVRRFTALKKGNIDLNLLLKNTNKLMEMIEKKGTGSP
ncbi:hypothetical protein TRFO_35175 [Tritrichomonas foetus]|uniref:Rab-GAP TBC domain-containing protein n=1 Tax=Tritrichomonas foetus TaxID=1144522 RepID=A0A1J4JIB4_9EUKA|nr:hypothetical protein TRFO_35175 [Tritrichomonas foetus]|eukprot:OHS98433.1 hypothetical protein TRFO_35175 [Tritrichomonas foetus]